MSLFELLCMIVGFSAGAGVMICFFTELFIDKDDKPRKIALACICVGIVALLLFTIESVIRVYIGEL